MLKNDINWCNLLIMICAWAFTSFNSYWIEFYIKYLRGSNYINATIMGFAALLSSLIFVVMINYIKELLFFSFFFLITFFRSPWYTITEECVSLLPMWIFLMVFALSMLFSLVHYSNYNFEFNAKLVFIPFEILYQKHLESLPLYQLSFLTILSW